eukprot:Polyplicarium_translucidae@DN3380_c2_g1_i4.p1
MKTKRALATKSQASFFLTRSQALRKLQVSIAEFRRLCILKGIYPRDPKKAPKGRQHVYFHAKDIAFLSREPLRRSFRDIRAHMKKYRKAIGRKELFDAKVILKNKPAYTVHHLVKERYPTVVDAVRDMDDALSLCAMYAALPSDKEHKVNADSVATSVRIIDEFHHFVTKKQALQRVFVSLKGIYFQATIMNEAVTWLIPHEFSQHMPDDVDFRVMNTFLEFYHTLLKFLLFKLFAIDGIKYPPTVFQSKKDDGLRHLALSSDTPATTGAHVDGETEEHNNDQEGLLNCRSKNLVFKDAVVFLSREVPRTPLFSHDPWLRRAKRWMGRTRISIWHR